MPVVAKKVRLFLLTLHTIMYPEIYILIIIPKIPPKYRQPSDMLGCIGHRHLKIDGEAGVKLQALYSHI